MASFLDIFRTPNLRQRVIYTIVVLIVYRMGTFIPVPGLNASVLDDYFRSQGSSTGQTIVDYFNFFSGGAFANFSIFMLSIFPYITTSIIMQLLVVLIPSLKAISEDDGGRAKIQQFTRFGTVLVCFVQSIPVIWYIRQIAEQFPSVIIGGGGVTWQFILLLVFIATVGTLLLVWMGEQITARGVGNGVSIIIAVGIIARIPNAMGLLGASVRGSQLNPVFLVIVFLVYVAVIVAVVYEQQGQRRIPVHYAKRIVGRKMYDGQNAYIPFKINPSGVIPVIFASALLQLPVQLLSGAGGGRFLWLNALLNPLGFPYMVTYTLLIVFFAYFYTMVSANPVEIARRIRENGGTIPGIRSENTESYLSKVLNRIILPGALFLAMIAIVPAIIVKLFNFPAQVAFLMGGTSLLIMVGVELDTMSQIEGHLKTHNYDGFLKKGRIRSRNL